MSLTAASTGADAVVAKGPSEEQDLVGAIAKLIKKKPRSATARVRRTKRSSA